MTCGIFGDSIAVGVALYLHGCAVSAKVGISSAQVLARVHRVDVAIISAGSNDPRNPGLERNLEAIKAKAGGRVIFIIPAVWPARATVLRVAGMTGGVDFGHGDGIHPTNYPALARRIRDRM